MLANLGQEGQRWMLGRRTEVAPAPTYDGSVSGAAAVSVRTTTHNLRQMRDAYTPTGPQAGRLVYTSLCQPPCERVRGAGHHRTELLRSGPPASACHRRRATADTNNAVQLPPRGHGRGPRACRGGELGGAFGADVVTGPPSFPTDHTTPPTRHASPRISAGHRHKDTKGASRQITLSN